MQASPDLFHLRVHIKVESVIEGVLQSSAAFSALINTQFQTTGHLEFDSPHYDHC